MRNFHLRKNQHHKPSINLDKLWTLVTEQTKKKYENHPEQKVPVIDCVRAVSLFYWSLLHSLSCDLIHWCKVKLWFLGVIRILVISDSFLLINVRPDVSKNDLKLTTIFSPSGFLQSSRQGCSSQTAGHCQGQILLQDCWREDSVSWWSMYFNCLSVWNTKSEWAEIQVFSNWTLLSSL